MRTPIFLLILLISSLLAGAGCRNTDDNASIAPADSTTVPTTSSLVRGELIGEYSVDDIRKRIDAKIPAGSLVRYGVRAYKITYTTSNTDNTPIPASGVLLVPVANMPFALFSLQHGTITNDKAAPSNYQLSSDAWTYGTILASTGYLISMPDYIGYGASRQIPHPYEHASSLASASVDMLRAVREFCDQQQIARNDQLFLAGYSEGGYATMALHKRIEEQHADEFTVTASSPGAGAYHKSAFARYILERTHSLEYINSYVWVLQTYNRVYNIGKTTQYYLNEPYASRVNQQGPTAEITKNPQQLFTPAFRERLLSGTDTAMLSALEDNDIYDWKPQAPMQLIHGTADNFVPFFNSQDAYDAMQRNGAAQVQLKSVEGGNHFTSVAAFVLQTYAFFSQFQPAPVSK